MRFAAFASSYVFLSTSGLILLRRNLEKTGGPLQESLGPLLKSPSFILGFLAYACSFFIFLIALRSFTVLTVYPVFTGLAYAAVTIAAVVVLNEDLSSLRLIAVSLIGAGVIMLSR